VGEVAVLSCFGVLGIVLFIGCAFCWLFFFNSLFLWLFALSFTILRELIRFYRVVCNVRGGRIGGLFV